MKNILIVEDTEIFRATISVALHDQGYKVLCARSGEEALMLLDLNPVDLILLDLIMPGMGGLACLEEIRKHPKLRDLPVILLTSSNDKQTVLSAKDLKVAGYILKTGFALGAIFEIVNQALQDSDETQPIGKTDEHNKKSIQNVELAAARNKNSTLDRVKKGAGVKSFTGAVSEVLTLATSGSEDSDALAAAISRDPVIVARVLQVANSATFASRKSHISDMNDAVQRLGFSLVCEIASSVGIVTAFSINDNERMNRYLQHAIGVALIMEWLAKKTDCQAQGPSYLVGLCHVLPEILLCQEFKNELDAVDPGRQIALGTSKDFDIQIFGVQFHEIVSALLSFLELPLELLTPITEHLVHHEGSSIKRLGAMAQLLTISNNQANAFLLAPSAAATVWPISKEECGLALRTTSQPSITESELLSKLKSKIQILVSDNFNLIESISSRNSTKIWYVRDEKFSGLDPFYNALQSLWMPELHQKLPGSTADLKDYKALIVVAPELTTLMKAQLSALSIEQKLQFKILFLESAESQRSEQSEFQVEKYPISLEQLKMLV